jgi:hypothetical protein
MIDRRRFVQNVAGIGSLAAIGGGLWARRAFATYRLQNTLVADISPFLMDKAQSEFQVVPIKGRDEIREWFHGKCLNVAPFVDEVCSDGYRQKLHACRSEADQQRLLMVSYFGKIATDAEIIIHVQTIVAEAGQELDVNWDDCCKGIVSRWNIHIKEYSKPVEATEFFGRVDRLVKSHLDDSLELARVSAGHPAFGETLGKIGESALKVMSMTQIEMNPASGRMEIDPAAKILAIPTFVFLALESLFQYIVGLFSDPRADLQRSISARLALLGNRIGDGFASELRERLDILHGWQERSLTSAAHHYADEAVGWL